MKITLQFSAEIKQTSGNSITMELPVREIPIFAPDAISRIAPDLSPVEQDKLADDIATFAWQESIRRSIFIVAGK